MEYNHDLYAGYNYKRYAHFRSKESGQYKPQEFSSAKSGKRLQPIIEKVEVPFEEVKQLNLDSHGVTAPTLDTEDFTIISNYLVDFWGAIMGNCPVDAYLHLKRHAYGKKDYCYIDIKLIALKMKRSVNTVKKYLDTLEEYGFIAIFHRIDKEDNNKDVSPFFKIRRYIPLITDEMYESLHPRLKRLHDSFMKSYEQVELGNKLFKTDDIIQSLVLKGKVINKNKVEKQIDESIKDGKMKDYILDFLSEEQREDNRLIHNEFKNLVPSEVYDKLFSNLIIFKHINIVVTLSPNEHMEYVVDQYSEFISEYFNCNRVIFNKYLDYINTINKATD